ncbi:hypothetical protein FHR81_004191 [Actinoalloteichus hoggarensis]|uniref:Uncharacterized protein n=1 Tax=Actinoalloteichus hoggarensis TaxID=1470176 RepID=A0A221W8X9_9PSEU|nr:hypothetical protein [Actinoalloteichus hoggarensis]ASO22452.1 hypothetical protein AHOG_24230 [Actinoalloteichus hoggarensis]MBB5923124.1 hypothetical protein [Actinoalloteichus hoggarensis]
MSDHYEVFFDAAGAGRSLEEVARLVSTAVDIPLQRDDDPDREYWAERDGVFFDLYSDHGMEDDAGIPFERMPYSLTLRSGTSGLDRQRVIAEQVFDRLCAEGMRPIYLVWGIERIIRHAD